MTNFSLVYLINRLFFRVGEFLRHWYVKSFHIYTNAFLGWLQQIDYTLAWRITLRNFFQPLYKDYSAVGYIFGFMFRCARLLIGGLVYVVIFPIALGLYIIWLLIPPYIIVNIFL